MMVLTSILDHTPPYVWAILAFLVWQGVQSLRTRTQALWRLTVVPLVFAASGIAVALRDGGDGSLVPWLAAALMAASLGAVTAPRILAANPGRFAVTRAGSPVPLVRNLIVFGAHYGLAVAAALHPEGQGAPTLAAGLLSGATVGYVAGWSLATFRDYRAAVRLLSPAPSSPAPHQSPSGLR